MPRFTTVLFDLDGTLIDSVRLILDSYHHTLAVHQEAPRSDDYWLAGLGNVADCTRCYRDSTQILVDDEPRGSLAMLGSEVADAALHDAYVAFRTRDRVPIFRVEVRDPIMRFEPERFLVVIAIDMAGLPNSGLGGAAPSRDILIAFGRVFQDLEVPVLIVGFWDHLVPISKRKARYLTVDVTAKDFDDPFDDGAALRMMHLLDHDSHAQPTSVCHPALHHKILMQRLLPEAEKRDAQRLSVFYFGSRWNEELWQSKPAAAVRMADAIEQEMTAAKQAAPGKWDGLEMLPRPVWEAAARGGWVREQHFDGGL